MPKKMRMRPVHPALKNRPPSGMDQSKFDRAVLPPRLAASSRYQYFEPRWHVRNLRLDSDFINSLNENARLLEIGPGTSRLTDYLLRNSSIKPENYELMDTMYAGSIPFLKRRVSKLIRKGKLKTISANMWDYPYPTNRYDHILIPEAYFPIYRGHDGTIQPAGWFGRLENDEKTQVASAHLEHLVRLIGPSLRHGGSIRLSHYGLPLSDEFKDKISREFKIWKSRGGLVLEKK